MRDLAEQGLLVLFGDGDLELAFSIVLEDELEDNISRGGCFNPSMLQGGGEGEDLKTMILLCKNIINESNF